MLGIPLQPKRQMMPLLRRIVMIVLIMAGGSGMRLWPLARQNQGKPFLRLFGRESLLQTSYQHAKALVHTTDRIFVATQNIFAEEVATHLPDLPSSHIFTEPETRDTAPALVFALARLYERGISSDEVLVQLPGDSHVLQPRKYQTAIRTAARILKNHPGATALLGQKPIYAETGYGYIEAGHQINWAAELTSYHVRKFVEKPNPEQAARLLTSGKHWWNTGVYLWKASTLHALFERHAPNIAEGFRKLQSALRKRQPTSIRRIYRAFPKISIDRAVTEKQDPHDIFLISGDFGWSDVGHWDAWRTVAPASLSVTQGKVVLHECSGVFVYADAPLEIGLVDVHEVTVVAIGDKILICRKGSSQFVKKLVEQLYNPKS